MTTRNDSSPVPDKGHAQSQTISRITNIITTAIKSKMHEIADSSTLLVNIGAAHGSLYDEIAQTDLMQALHKDGIPFICTLEREKNKVATALARFTRIKDIDGAIDRLHQDDSFDDLERIALIRSTVLEHAPLSGSLQIDFMHDNDIAYHLIDSNRIFVKNKPYLDTNNKQVVKSLARAEGILGENSARWHKFLKPFATPPLIALDSTKGILTRNFDMIDACLELSKNAKLILVFSGIVHTIGTNRQDTFSSAAHTIPYLAKQVGLECIGIDLSSSTKHVPDYHLIQERILNTPPTPLSLDDLFDAKTVTEIENRSGQDDISYLKREEQKIGELTLAWIAPYRNQIKDRYLRTVGEFNAITDRLQMPEQ